MFYGLPREVNETSADCEASLRDLLTDKLEIGSNVQFDRVHRVNSRPDSPLIACFTFYKDKLEILKAKTRLKGSRIFIGEDFSLGVRQTRKKLAAIMKEKRNAGHKVSMIYDHLIIDGEKFFLASTGELTSTKR